MQRLVRCVAFVVVVGMAGCPETEAPTPDVAADAVQDQTIGDAGDDADAGVVCCPLSEVPSCDCTQLGGTSIDGTCSAVCDAASEWTQAVDENGCPYWIPSGGSCGVPVDVSGGDGVADATEDAAGDVADGDGGPEDAAVDGDASGADVAGKALGEACSADAECQSGVCWDFSAYDPFCGGAVCSVTCGGDADCQTAFAAAGAPSPQAATCRTDGRCDPVSTGVGGFFCQ